MKKNIKRMIAVIMMLSMMVMNSSITHAYAVQNHDYVLDRIDNIKVLKNKAVLKGKYVGYRLGVRIDGKTYYGEFADTNVEANEEGFIYDDIVTLSVGYPILNEGETVSAWLEGRDSYKTEERNIEVMRRKYNISAKAGSVGVTGNVEQYGNYKIYVKVGDKEYLCKKTKLGVEKTGYNFMHKLPKLKFGSTVKVIVRDSDGYENSKSLKVKKRTPILWISPIQTTVSEVSGATDANSHISIKIGKKKYKCKSDVWGDFVQKIKIPKAGTKIKVKVTTPEGYSNEKQAKIETEIAPLGLSEDLLENEKKIKISVSYARKGDKLKVYIGKNVYSYIFKKNKFFKKVKLKIKRCKAGTKIKVCLYDKLNYKRGSCQDAVR